jgi:FkbH-like protein
VFSVSARDRFADHGIIGVMILRFGSGESVIDTLLLSCRVIGRGIEQAMVAFAAEQAVEKGAGTVIGEFLPTAKNQPAAGFYEKVGFERRSETVFAANARALMRVTPSFLKICVTDAATQRATS